MKVVIDIPEEIYNNFEELGYTATAIKLVQALNDGVVLSKGHGNLYDFKDITRILYDEISKEQGQSDSQYLEGLYRAYALIASMNPIIKEDPEADELKYEDKIDGFIQDTKQLIEQPNEFKVTYKANKTGKALFIGDSVTGIQYAIPFDELYKKIIEGNNRHIDR